MCIDQDLLVGGRAALRMLHRGDVNRIVGAKLNSMVSGLSTIGDGPVPGEQESLGDLLSVH